MFLLGCGEMGRVGCDENPRFLKDAKVNLEAFPKQVNIDLYYFDI